MCAVLVKGSLPFPPKHTSNSRFIVVLQGWESDGPPAVLDIMAQSTSIQRIQRLIDSVPLTNLLLTLLSTSYRKVGMGIQLGKFCSSATPTEYHLHAKLSLYKLCICKEVVRILLLEAVSWGLSLFRDVNLTNLF